MVRLSVIVCVYNTSQELFNECLTSVFASSLSSFEVIVVDDGSSVDYERLKKKFPKAKFIKTEHKGTLNARLFGLSNATGEYVAYLDSDDKVSFNFYEALVSRADSMNADVVFNDWAYLTSRSSFICENNYTIKNLFMADGSSVLKMYFYFQGKEHAWYVLWNKIIKRELILKACKEIEKLNINNLSFCEDILITFFVFAEAKKITNVHLGYYFYRVHSDQQTCVTSKENFLSQINQMAKVFDIMERELKIIGRFDEVKHNFFEWKKLASSSNYMVGKKLGFEGVNDEIKNAYGVQKLKKLSKDAAKAFFKHKFLPLNFEEIDEAIKKVSYSNKYLKVYAKPKSYAMRELLAMKRELSKRYDITKSKKDSTFVMPKEKNSLKQKIVHNHFVYRVGMVLFPRNSKFVEN